MQTIQICFYNTLFLRRKIMQNRSIALLFVTLFMLLGISGCTTINDTNSLIVNTPIQEHYEFKQREKICFFPSFTNENEKAQILSVSTVEGTFVCMTTEESQADSFINAQRTLLHFLQDNGVELRNLNYVAINFDDNFSESEKNTAYIALSSTKTWKQVFVTLQTLWGDFTDYGYVYAMSNAIASHLGWETDDLLNVENDAMDSFFRENSKALNLLYPSFTERYASKETVTYSKLLSLSLFDDINLCNALKKPIETQLDDFEALIHKYSEKIGVSFSRQVFGYAYRGPYLPLCIQTTYATHVVDHNYKDYHNDIYEDYFGDYITIYQTAEILEKEVVDAVKSYNLQNCAGNVCINWLSEESAMTKFAKPHVNTCYVLMKEAYVTTISLYLNVYYQHIENLINPDSEKTWQSLAFCEIGRSYSQPALYATEKTFTQDSKWAELYYSFTGHTYQSKVEHYYEVFDVLVYTLNDDFSLDYHKDGAFLNSFTYYLIKNYGEEAIIDLMLSPNTVNEVTGKNWDTLENEWKQSIVEKYSDKQIPDWLIQGY